MVKCAVIIVAAGRGHRFCSDMPKQYCDLGGRMILSHTLAAFCAHPLVHSVTTVIHPDDVELFKRAAKGLFKATYVFGGKERQDSVRLGLQSLKDENPDVVLIHDAARPFVSFDLINRVIAACADKGAIPALPVVDTLKFAGEGNLIQKTVDRKGLWRVQTPQGFPFAQILKAHEQAAGKALTDDAAVAESAGMSVVLIDGDEDNFKITTAADLTRAQKILNAETPECRTGLGFDVHAFAQGDGVWLCGVKIPHGKKLEGHSDADVALHALTDAILGAIGAGDIGVHFPPSDNRWKGKESSFFLKYAVALVKARGGRLVNVDLTVICEEPKVNKFRLEIVQSLSEMLELPAERIGFKGTTTEKLGFTGRKEGIAAQAVATVLL